MGDSRRALRGLILRAMLDSARIASLRAAPLAAAILLLAPAAPRAQEPQATIPVARFALENGLQVVLHRDPTVPLVAVNVNYNVGSGDERVGRTGFAHLFEHLMFMGTVRVPQGSYDAWMEAAGGWNNAWTSEDRTDYYDVGPRELLRTLLWMEADRMEALGSVLGQEQLDLQRDVVRNERRESENEPYGVVWFELPGLLFPQGHPYAHPVLGSHEDLVAASVEDVRSFFATWYAPRNASLVVAGDFDPAQAEAWIREYFGGIGNSPEAVTAQRATAQPAAAAPGRRVLGDRVHSARIVFCWRTAPLLLDQDAHLDIAATVLAGGKASRLYRALVHGQELAQDVMAVQFSGRLESVFYVQATVREGVDPQVLEQAMAAEIEKLRAEGPSDDELLRARAGIQHAFVRRLDGVEGRASLLNGYMAIKGTPDWIDQDRKRYLDASTDSVRQTAAASLDPAHQVVIVVQPREDDGAEPAAPAGEEVAP